MEQASGDKDLQSDSPQISWPLGGASSITSQVTDVPPQSPFPTRPQESPAIRTERLFAAQVLAGQSKSLAGVSLRAFLLGLSLGSSILLSSFLAYHQLLVWRASFFIAALSLFHFLEYYITAAYNTQYANISAFLLSQNGKAYNVAHTAALIECLVRTLFFPSWQATYPQVLCIGLAAMAVGQVTRSMAMAQAGTNFNHTVQTQRVKGHELVTHGIYGVLRHPSYFGFFWWGLGTQVVLGNIICFLAYATILWGFFSRRIHKEEEFLVAFFGKDYETYRSRTRVGIPFIP